jgi:hypothetical protein
VTPLYPQKLALTSPTGGGRSVGIVRSRTKAMEFISENIDKVTKNEFKTFLDQKLQEDNNNNNNNLSFKINSDIKFLEPKETTVKNL